MRTHVTTTNPRLMHFISLASVAREVGAKSQRHLLADLRTLTPRERREVADLVKKEG
jgi:hypothetical protein